MTDDSHLLAALAVIQARGAIGERSLADAVAHADRFVELIPFSARSVIDLGSGGGLPALVIAWRRDELMVTMVERRATRADLLRRAIMSLGLAHHATVLEVDVAQLRAGPDTGPDTGTVDGSVDVTVGFDVVTARSFADPATTTRFIDELLAEGGVALVSEPPKDRSAQWAAVLDCYPRLTDGGVEQGIRCLRRV